MSKSILILETPVSCRNCPLRYDPYGHLETCYIEDLYVYEHYEEGTKPYWCPLRPLPPYKNLKPDSSLESQFLYQFNQGYNTCLQEIEGEEND